ncbi:GH25 family lysozyme [uncultured Gemmiger sp.]|uniref:GH25 family lysozyme n=1 Tax=uncultured Gemmiger sp. TaxID=1623490 RepID=UPI002591C912|nr:GH25 family lysozyme [uncultured Gemmiger sp.]
MFTKKNPMRYFSGSTFARLPLYKLAAGGTAVVLTASIGLGAFAASVGPLSAPEPSPTPIVTATPETAATPTPSPTPSPTPEPDKPLTMEASVIQQDVGVTLYVENAPEPSPTPDASASPSPTPSKSAKEEDAENEKTPLLGVAATITLTDAKGNATDYELDTETGTALAEDVTPGDYTLAVQPIEGYTQPEAQTVTVKEKVVYKADVKAVKEKIVQASQVNESAEDSGVSNAGSAPIVNEVTDTVTYADSAKTETGSKTSYTAKLSSSGHLLLADGTETPYLPVYQDGTKDLIGAVRDTSYAANTATAAWLPGAADSVTLLGAASTRMAWVHRADEPVTVQEDTDGAAPAAEETPVPADPTPEPTPESTPEPTPEATPAPTAAPTEAPAETEPPAPTEAPTAAPTEAPTATPTQAPTQVPDPTAGWPDNIAVQELANYGFAVTSATTTTYEYTGWQDIDGATYYYDPSTHQPVTGQQVIQGNVYTFAADGALNRTARGIDVSKFQGSIDWNAVKADGITFAIIRCGYRGYGSGALVEDSTYRQNIQGAINAGLRVGVYFYSQAINEAEAVEEASMVLSLVSGYSLPLGVYYDTESVGGGRANALSAAERTACAVAFCETIRSAGYSAGVYSYASWFYNALNFANISKYNIWIAQYRDTLSFSYKHNIWQYTGSGSVNGISKPVDMNIG